ncbi:Cysteine--tRNA ligase, chloroplastic/mitochondrial, partial [Cucurbita argyrosperma subsp. sororia]
MASLLKLYDPLMVTRFSPISVSQAILLRRTRRHFRFPFFKSARCFSTSLGLSQHPVNEENHKEIGGVPRQCASSELWLHNTMSRKKELFKTKVEGKVGMYVCGVTAYDLSHIGHARVYVTFDVLYRYLKHLGYEVLYVRNFTDVDDKIIVRANELGEDPLNLSKRYCEEFCQDMVSLHCLPPSVEPRVSDHMPQIIDMIKQILDHGYAYCVDGDVYFNVDKFPEYGLLSGRKLEDNRAGERVAVDSRKKNPADFALWKTLDDCKTVVSQQDESSLKGSIPPSLMEEINQFYNVFLTSMSDDIHTNVVLAALSDPLKIINDLLHTHKGKKQKFRIESLAALENIIGRLLSILGLMPASYSEALGQLKEKALTRAKMTNEQVVQKIEERNAARKNKEYEKSDAIRNDLAGVGITLMDGPNGTTWRPTIPLALQEHQSAST